MMFQLRDYQQECVQSILDGWRTMGSQLVQLPTGAGKTVILWHVLKAMGKRALLVAPTRELTEQLEETGKQVVDPSSVYRKTKSYWPADKQYMVMTGQAATFALKDDALDQHPFDVLIVDEAHRSRSRGLEALIQYARGRGAVVLGLTATPERLDGRSLLELYEGLTYSVTLLDLIHKGHLVDLECYKIKTHQKLEGVKYYSGDFAQSALRQLDVDSRNEIILDVYKSRCPGTRCLVFCLNVEHAQQMAHQFQSHGVRAEAVHGGLPRKVRSRIVNDFKSGALDVLCNCQLLTEGFDCPPIQSLILARPTKSKALYCQMIGRGVRPYKDKTCCYVYDLSDEIHNVCTFNLLGNIADESTFEFEEGERLTAATERHKLHIDDVDYEVERFELLEKQCTFPAARHQLELMDMYNIPYLPDITMPQAAYLLFKTALMRDNGIDTAAYWKEWRQVEGSGKACRGEGAEQVFCRL